jgi:hypothetical protein
MISPYENVLNIWTSYYRIASYGPLGVPGHTCGPVADDDEYTLLIP